MWNATIPDHAVLMDTLVTMFIIRTLFMYISVTMVVTNVIIDIYWSFDGSIITERDFENCSISITSHSFIARLSNKRKTTRNWTKSRHITRITTRWLWQSWTTWKGVQGQYGHHTGLQWPTSKGSAAACDQAEPQRSCVVRIKLYRAWMIVRPQSRSTFTLFKRWMVVNADEAERKHQPG